jgi:hypothetical protein
MRLIYFKMLFLPSSVATTGTSGLTPQHYASCPLIAQKLDNMLSCYWAI